MVPFCSRMLAAAEFRSTVGSLANHCYTSGWVEVLAGCHSGKLSKARSLRQARAALVAAGALGHRERLRTLVLQGGTEALDDLEMLELLLCLALPRCDLRPIARALLARFGSFPAAIATSVAELRRVPGLGDAGVAALKTVQIAASRLARAEVAQRSILDGWDRLIAYLNTVLARERVEHCRVLFLDFQSRLLADEMITRGTVDQVALYPREVVKRALELDAIALILVHNHPSGDPTPSGDDWAMSEKLRIAAGALGIIVQDHIVVGNGLCYSFLRRGFFRSHVIDS